MEFACDGLSWNSAFFPSPHMSLVTGQLLGCPYPSGYLQSSETLPAGSRQPGIHCLGCGKGRTQLCPPARTHGIEGFTCSTGVSCAPCLQQKQLLARELPFLTPSVFLRQEPSSGVLAGLLQCWGRGLLPGVCWCPRICTCPPRSHPLLWS